jgi:sugar lactone lactonase YvrE
MKVFSNHRCILGEGPLWHSARASFFWVDINSQRVFEKHVDSENYNYDNCWSIPCKPSALTCVVNQSDEIWVICSQGLAMLDVITGSFTLEVTMVLAEGMRTNDAGVGPDAKLWIGTIEDAPIEPNGALYSIAADGNAGH